MDHYHDDDDANVSANGQSLKPPAPEFVGEDGLAPLLLGLPPSGSSSVGESSTSSILPRPPIPPLATERERLVERERQARLETERARRRQALLREQSLDDEMNSLSLPMERFLERSSVAVMMNEGGGQQPGSVVSTNEQTTIIDNNANGTVAALPYTMELFLAKNAAAVVGPPRDDDTSQMHYDNIIDDGTHPPISPIVPLLSLTPDESNFNEESPMAPSLEDERIIRPTDAHIILHLPNSEDDGDVSAEISWGGSAASSASNNNDNNNDNIMPTHHSIGADMLSPRLTEAGIAQLAEVDRASIGNAAPQSDRSEPSESDSVVNDDRDERFDNGDQGTSFDRTFSVATQTTARESSVTDVASDGLREEERYVKDLDEIDEHLNVFRVNSDISLHTHSSGGGDASSSADASVVAMPSTASAAGGDSTSDDDDNFIRQDTSFSSTYDTNIAPRLTEADLVIQAEIDNASIGNAPPYSERGDELSESSVTERGGSGGGPHHHAIRQWKERVQSLESDVILLEQKLLQKVDEAIVAKCCIANLETALCESESKVQMLLAELKAKEFQSSKNNTQQKFA